MFLKEINCKNKNEVVALVNANQNNIDSILKQAVHYPYWFNFILDVLSTKKLQNFK